MPSLFISYCHEEKKYADRTEKYLVKLGISVHKDDNLLCPGDPVIDVLTKALKDADGVVILLSKASLNSPWVQHETMSALNKVLKRSSKPFSYISAHN